MDDLYTPSTDMSLPMLYSLLLTLLYPLLQYAFSTPSSLIPPLTPLSYTPSLHPLSTPSLGLTYPSDGQFNEWMRDSGIVNAKKIRSNADAARQLCNVAFSLDLAALKFLLYDTGSFSRE